MLIVFSEDLYAHESAGGLWRGQMVPCFDTPERPKRIIAGLRNVGFERILAPKPITSSALQTVHDPGFIQFLEAAWDRWSAEGRQGMHCLLLGPLGPPAILL